MIEYICLTALAVALAILITEIRWRYFIPAPEKAPTDWNLYFARVYYALDEDAMLNAVDQALEKYPSEHLAIAAGWRHAHCKHVRRWRAV